MDRDNKQKIRVDLAGKNGDCYGSEPITFGVPFAEGALRAHDTIRVTDTTGRTIPIQTEGLTTWEKDGEQIKWLLADLQTDDRIDSDSELTIEYPVESDKDAAPPVPGLRIDETADLISVDTGPLRVEFSRSFEVWKVPS